jgi:enoyl-CoA hydratase/carnithine racemase
MPVLEAFDKPLVAAVNGMAVGIGTTLLPFCDVVLASTDARFKVPFMPLGVTTEAAGSLLLPERMGWQRAARMVFTASWLSAAEAQEAGLVLEVVEPEALVPSALDLARTIAAMPLDSLVTTKRLMMAARGDAVRAARQREDAEFARMVGSAANAAALASFSKG